jgi:predicted peptidase
MPEMEKPGLKSKILLFSFFCCLGTTIIFAQSLRFSSEKFINGKGDTLIYRLLVPDYDTLRKYPLVLFLHGSGERGNDNELQLKWGVMNFATDQAMVLHPAFILVPQCPADQEWYNISENEKTREIKIQPLPSKPMELVIELVRKFMKDLRVDTNRIYITGLSSGGYGTYDAIERYPDLFAAAIPVCGAGDVSKAALFAHIPIWIFQGSEDAGVNPLCSADMVEALTRAGTNPGFTLYPGIGHFAWLAAYSDPLVMEWLFRQRKHSR